MTRRPRDHRARALSITTLPLWRLAAARELPRYVLTALALAGIAASARYAIDPPRAALRAPSVATAPEDLAAAGYAVLFARRYLEWSAAAPQRSVGALAPFTGAGIEAGAAMQPPPAGEQHVVWAQVVQAREPASGNHVYTVAAQTDTAGLLYLAVPVVRLAGGVALAGYPAFVGPPSSVPAPAPAQLREVADAALATVVTRALRNYLAGAGAELAADLSPGARVSLPALAIAVRSLERLVWSTDGRSVVAVIDAQDARGARYTLQYEVDVARMQGRWEVGAIEVDPGA